MTKKNIKEGDIVLLRDERICIVYRHDRHDDLLLYGKSAYDTVNSHNLCALFNLDNAYNDDLTYIHNNKPDYDIMAVCHSDDLRFLVECILDLVLSRTPGITVIWDWQREDVKEVTMAEVEKKFGCKVKIVKEN